MIGGEGGTRTHKARKDLPAFKAGAFANSATSPVKCGHDSVTVPWRGGYFVRSLSGGNAFQASRPAPTLQDTAQPPGHYGLFRWLVDCAASRFGHSLIIALILVIAACSGPTTSSGGGQERDAGLSQTDREAFAMTGGFQGYWLRGSKEVQRRDIPIGGAYPGGLIVLGNDTLNQPVTWIAGVMIHESCHHRGAIEHRTICSSAEETRCIREQIEFDKTIGGAHVEWLESQIGAHDCKAE